MAIEFARARYGGQVDPEVAASLRAAGFRWNRYLRQWEGKVLWDDAKGIVESTAGKIERVPDALA